MLFAIFATIYKLPNMNYKSGFYQRFIILLTAFVVFALPVQSQASFSDTAVENLMNRFRYNEAKEFINRELKDHITTGQHARLYYFTQLAFAHYRLKNADSALYSVRTALHLAKGNNDSALVVNTWKAAAYTYNLAGINDSSVLFSKLMLDYGERNNDLKLTKNALNALAAMANKNKKPEVALQYFKEAYVINKVLNDTADLGGNMFNLGLTYLNLNILDSSLYSLQKSIEHSRKFNNTDLLILTYNVTAGCYRKMENFDKQKEYLLLSNQLAEKTGNYRYTANNLSQLMMTALKKQNYEEALSFGDKAITFLSEHPAPAFQITIDSLMYVAQKGLNNYAKALEYYQSFVHRKNAIYNEKQLKSLNEMIVQHDLDKKNLIIMHQETEILSNRRYLIIIAAVSVILFLLLAGLVTHIVKTRQFRHELYLKEEYLDSQIHNLHECMEWKRIKPVQDNTPELSDNETPVSEPSPGESLARQGELFAAFYDLCENQKIFLNPELTQEEVIKMLGTNKKYFYEAISSNTSENFKSLINRYRVNEAKRQIKMNIWQNSGLKMDDVMVASGFNAPSSFYRVFKSVTGLTPAEYASETRLDFIRHKKDSRSGVEQAEMAA